MLPTPKVYKVDYDFLIKNYLDPSLWSKTWTIYVYKDNVFTLSLYNIYCNNMTLTFAITYNKLEQWRMRTVSYPLNEQMSINILMNKINGTIWDLMNDYEETLIRKSDGYKEIQSQINEESDHLREIAEEYLDDNNVTNDEIREAYINTYVANNSKVDGMLSNYVSGCRYRFLTEDMLVYTKAIDSEPRFNAVVQANSIETVNKILLQVKEEMSKWDDEHIDDTRAEYYDYCEEI